MSTNTEKIDTSSPLYLHPSDGTSSVVIEKLQGVCNYREWRRDFEITLAAKRKLGLNKLTYETKQQGKSVSEYYTEMRVIWEELESLTCSNCGKSGHLFEKCWACKACGKSGHTTDKCWSIVGYPSWFDKGKMKDSESRQNVRAYGSNDYGGRTQQKWNKNKHQTKRMAGNAKICSEESKSSSSSTALTAQQLEQLLKLLPSISKEGNDTDEEIDLPTAETSGIVASGKVKLNNGIELRNKLSQDSNCKVVFLDNHCIIQDKTTSEVKGVGKARKGLYYLVNESLGPLLTRIRDQVEKGQMCK
ncbi:Gag polyprotein, partial [Bienertia sinuspersici]